MNVRNSLAAGVVAFGFLMGASIGASAAASAAPVESTAAVFDSTTISAVRPVCQWPHYKLVQDRNGRWYCKFAPVNRRDRPRR